MMFIFAATLLDGAADASQPIIFDARRRLRCCHDTPYADFRFSMLTLLISLLPL